MVTDPRCDASRRSHGKSGDATPGQLDPGDRWTYTCTAQTTGQPAGTFVNTANVTGKDLNGRKVTDTDAFPTMLEAQQVLPEEIVSGAARLRGPSGCVKKAFKATVRGRQIASVTFYVDGEAAQARSWPRTASACSGRRSARASRSACTASRRASCSRRTPARRPGRCGSATALRAPGRHPAVHRLTSVVAALRRPLGGAPPCLPT